MGFNCGIVGLPNTGKTTIFNALTGLGHEVSSYPFTTTKPEVGRVTVPDLRLEKIQDLVIADKVVYTSMEVIDIPGLSQGASKGDGMGNRFLEHIQKTDALLHVIRCFEDPDIMHIADDLDPVRDADIVNSELILADLELISKQIFRLQKSVRSGDKEAKVKLDLLEQFQEHLYEEKPLREFTISDDDRDLVKELSFLTFKPVLYIANVSEDAIESDNNYTKALKELAQKEGSIMIKLSGQVEADIADLDPEEQTEFLEELGLKESGLYTLIREGYKLLNLSTFFTVGGSENRAWTIRKNSTALIAAGKIHSDIQRGFIRAEVFHYEDLIAHKTEAAIKDKGLFRLEGKQYLVKDGDILHFRFNV